MISNRLWRLYRLSRRIWVRITLMALLAVLAAIAAVPLDRFIPDGLADRFGADSVTPVLNILASSMLVVVTFSLSVMVAAQRQAASQITPRSQRLLMEDTTTQTVLATFLGAFIFALVAIILFRAGFYTGRASVIVFGVTVLVVVLVVLAILRWIEHLSHLGSMDETLARLEDRVAGSLKRYRQAPFLRARPLAPGGADLPTGLVPVASRVSGYVQFIDMPSLNDCATDNDVDIHVVAVPGDWVSEGDPVAYLDRVDGSLADAITGTMTMEAIRTFDQDPRFGLLVISEIAERALSPGINDPGTATDAISRVERMLVSTCPSRVETEDIAYDRVHVTGLREADLIDAAFAMIARDGADKIEVAGRLMAALRQIARQRDPDLSQAAQAMSDRVLAYADAAMLLDDDKARLRAIAGGS